VTSIAHSPCQVVGDRDDNQLAEVAERLDSALNTAYAKGGELPFPVRRVGAQYGVLKQPSDRWLQGEASEPPTEPTRTRLTSRRPNASRSCWPTPTGCRATSSRQAPWLRRAKDPQPRLLNTRFAAGPAAVSELAAHPLLPRPVLPD
jgi:hypothetical protein